MNPDDKSQPAYTPPTPEGKIPPKSLRTYQGDVEEALAHGKGSITSIFIAEQKRKDQTILDPDEEPVDTAKRNKIVMISSVVLITLGILTVSVVYYIKSRNQIIVEQNTKALIAFTEEKVLPVASSTRNSIIDSIVTEKNFYKAPVNSVLYINMVNIVGEPMNIELFLPRLFPSIPTALPRTFEGKYMFGIYSFDTNEPFILLKSTDFPSTYAGMLKWEKDMVSDFGRMFDIQLGASSTPQFIDEELRNKDLRVLRDEAGNTVLLYSFLDKSTLVITANENIFTAILGKYLINSTPR